MNTTRRRTLTLLILYFVLLAAYLLIAQGVFAPRGYYGTVEAPRFADPWIERSRTILEGGLLYRDVFTATPVLTNLLLVPPSLVAILVGNVNPGATLAFMLWFGLFNLLTALVLVRMGATASSGLRAAALFLLNPLTFSNAILRRQDESILVFFLALALLTLVRGRHLRGAVAVGVGLLIKLQAVLLIPVGFIHSRDRRYLYVPIVVFLLGMLPFLVLAGRDAIFWDFTTSDAQHPFQFDGVALAVLWNQLPGDHQVLPLAPFVLLFLLGTLATVAYIAYRRKGILEDFLLLTSVVLILSPKLHTGYLSMVVLVMAPLLRGRAMALGYFLFGAAAVAADFYKWPVADFRVAFWLMVAALGLLGLLVVRIYGGPDAEVLTGQRAIGRLRPTDLRSHPIDG